MRRRILVIEPHMDDAVLSVGASMAELASSADLTVLSVVRWSNFDGFSASARAYDVAATSARRLAEARAACAALGATHEALDERDSMLRFRPAEAWSVASAKTLIPAWLAWQRFGPRDDDVDRLAAVLRARIAALAPDELWAPLGIGGHVDHAWTRDAALGAIERAGLANGARVMLYADAPYAALHPRHAASIVEAIEAAGGALEVVRRDVTSTFERQRELLALYPSQFDAGAMGRLVERGARAAAPAGARYGELSWELRRPPEPSRLRSSALASSADEIQYAVERLPEAAARVCVVCTGAAGDWERAVAGLVRAFPIASMDLFYPARFAFELPPSLPPNVRARAVNRLSGWSRAFDASREADLAIVAWDAGPRRAAAAVRRLAARGRARVLPSLGDVALALAAATIGRTPRR